MKTACLFLTWNSVTLLQNSIGRLQSLLPDLAIIVVDNGSTDGSVALIRERWPRVELMPLAHNTGFAGGNNVGLKAAIRLGFEAVFLLNTDVIIDEDFITPCVERLRRDATIGVIGPTVLEAYEANVIQCEGARIIPLTLNFDYRRIREPFVRRDELVDVGYVLGASMLIRREVIEQIGYLDEEFYPAYVEEADFCYRAKRAGFRSVVHQGSAIRHIGAQSSGGNQLAFNRLSRQRFYFGIKHLGPCAFLIGSIAVVARVFYWKCRARLTKRD